jgi:hypothetical protein
MINEQDATTRRCPKCDDGWICECHPEKPWPHPAAEGEESISDGSGDCLGPGMPCDEPGCPDSMAARPS